MVLADGTGNIYATGNPLPVSGTTLLPSANFTTTAATTAWAQNQLVANSATAASVTALAFANAVRVPGGTAAIRRASLSVTADTGFAGQSFTLKLYTSAPTCVNGDRATWLTNQSGFIGDLAITLSQGFSDFVQGTGAPTVGSEINFAAANGSTTIYGLLVSNSNFSPQAGSRVITASLEVLAN